MLIASVITALGPARARPLVAAPGNNAVAGTWRLLSYTSTTEKGEVRRLMGDKPTGFLTYTREGRMAVVITAEGRKPFSVNDRVAAPAQERAQAFATLVAYAGRYELSGDTMTHHVEAAAVPNLAGTDLVRKARFEGDRITLRTPPQLTGGEMVVTELVWERMR